MKRNLVHLLATISLKKAGIVVRSGVSALMAFMTIAAAASTVQFKPAQTYSAGRRLAMPGYKRIWAVIAEVLVTFSVTAAAQGQVTFSSQTYPLTQTPFQVVTGDFNGDGRPDVAVMSVTAGTVSILLANADGTLSAAHDFPAITPQFSCVLCSFFPGIAVGDVNGDGKLDLVLADSYNPAGPSINVLLGNGDGTFGSAISTVINSVIAADAFLGVADFNGDKKLDVAVFISAGDSNGPIAFLGNGDGTFTPSIMTPAGLSPVASVVADVNGDGTPDIVISTYNPGGGSLVVFLGNGDGTFRTGSQMSEQAPWSATLLPGDFNNDGDIDLASASPQAYDCEFGVCHPIGPGGALAMLSGKGDGTFGGPGVLASGNYGLEATGDFDGDGNLDLVALGAGAISPASPVIMLGDGHGNFPSKSAVSFSNATAGMVSADFNGDGLADIALLNGDLQIELNTTPGFSLAASGSGSGISPGASATYTVNVGQQNGFSSAVTLACSAPASVGIGCSVSPSSVTPGGSTTLTVTTTAASSGLVLPSTRSRSNVVYALWVPIGAFLFGGIGITKGRCGRKKLTALVLGCVVSSSLILQLGCASGSKSIGTPAGSYTISITGTAGSLKRSTTATLTVE